MRVLHKLLHGFCYWSWLLLLPLLLIGCGGPVHYYNMPGTLPEVIGPDGKVVTAVAAQQAQPTLMNVVTNATEPPQQVALLLPLSGDIAKSGKAVRNGFLAAYYYAKAQKAKVPEIKVYDTNTADSQSLYAKAIKEGADFVVGPLTKANVVALASGARSLPVPILALNTLPDYQDRVTTNFYQFGLSPVDEVLQLAAKAYQDGVVNVLIIAPQNAWSSNLSTILANNFIGHGGRVIDSLNYDEGTNLAKQVGEFLTTDQSRQRALAIQGVLHDKVKYSLRRRQDFDGVLLLATPEIARQVRPLLRFYYAGSIPVYATSMIYRGEPNLRADQDLNGVIFCDMPWVLDKPNVLPAYLQATQQEITTLWPDERGQYNKLYALGIDAYNLLPFLVNSAQAFPSNGVFGASGELYLDQYQHIYRRLKWAKFVHGKAEI